MTEKAQVCSLAWLGDQGALVSLLKKEALSCSLSLSKSAMQTEVRLYLGGCCSVEEKTLLRAFLKSERAVLSG